MNKPELSVYSVAVDVGTTSTRLCLTETYPAAACDARSRRSRQNSTPTYQSSIHKTPLTPAGQIDGVGIQRILLAEYAQAGIDAAQVHYSAVVVTGESARRRHVNAVVSALSCLPNQFVVTSAGPNLEGELSGRGSGAAQSSKQRRKTICNIDIGGSTTNISVFKSGQLVSTACLAVGGSLFHWDENFRLSSITDAGKAMAVDVFRTEMRVGGSLTSSMIKTLASRAAKVIVDVACLRKEFKFPDGWLESRLLMSKGQIWTRKIDEFWFSGGVAASMSDAVSGTTYGDIGGELGAALLQLLNGQDIPFSVVEDPIRATLTGIRLHNLYATSSTVVVEPPAPPVCKIPVVRPLAPRVIESTDDDCTSTEVVATDEAPVVALPIQQMMGRPWVPEDPREFWELLANDFAEALAAWLRHHDVDWSEQPVALLLPELADVETGRLGDWVRALCVVAQRFEAAEPITLVVPESISGELNSLFNLVAPREPVIVIAGDDVSSDFIDIGIPLSKQQPVPAILKELIFAR